MEMLKRLTDVVTGEPYLCDGKGFQFRRTVCALSWPWEALPGCVCVLGELRRRPTVMGEDRHLHLLAETRSDSPAELLRAAETWLWQFRAPRIVTPEDDRRIMLLDVENDRRRQERKAPLRAEPPLAWRGKGEGLAPYYLALLHARLVEAKTLVFGRETSLPMEIKSVSGQKMDSRPMIQWPGFCALGWAVEAIDGQPMREWGARVTRGAGGSADEVGGY